MKSLRTRLTLAAIATAVLMTGLAGGLLYGLIQDDLEAQLDESLLNRARAQAALVEFDEEGLQFEWQHSPGIERSGALPRYFQVRSVDGGLLAHSTDLPDPGFPFPAFNRGRDAQTDDVTLPGDNPGRAVTLAFTPKIDDEAREEPPALLLIVAEPTSDLDATLARFRLMFGAAGLGGLIVAIALLRLILWRELKPVNELAAKIATVDEGSLGRTIEVAHAPTELRPVIDQLNALLARVDDTLRREHEFTAGAAHELRTPLAGLRGKLELALSRERTPDQHREFAQSGLEVALQMQALVESLLNLARTDAPEPPVQIDLREALHAAWKPMAEQASRRGLHVNWEFAGEKISAPPGALQLIAANLFENAVSYADEGGRIEINADATCGLLLEVANTGCTLRPDQCDQVFEPFWRADQVRTVSAHAGLGLAISRRVARKSGGEISVQIIKDRFVARVTIPRKDASSAP